ncbi:family 43 glycosylhydrolase [Pendulispora rubella]|uniref:Family 43 glycosylhydrolase n=1 Tax=Pendulispora rubella TaxID=2741070 RepID=A0ABZ2LFJ8_9BACT
MNCSNEYEVTSDPFFRIYDPSAGESEPWYINDHAFIRGPDGTWHLFGITHTEPAAPLDEKSFAHATSPSLADGPWQKQPPALVADPAYGETLLWAPYILLHEGTYYMFYCAGSEDHARYRIRLATSTDLWTWTRAPEPLFEDGFDARDPMVIRVGDRWVMYYTATLEPSGGAHVVAYRTSKDLHHFGERRIAFRDPSSGTFGGPTESPFVVARDGGYYLFIGPRDAYSSTAVYFSDDPFHFEPSQRVGAIASHAAEVVQDADGTWYASAAGWGQGGVYLARLRWEPVKYVTVNRPAYRAIVQVAPRAALRSFVAKFPGAEPRELLASSFRATGPYLSVGAFGVTDRPGAPVQVEASADGARLALKGIPMGNEPVTLDWTFTFGEEHIDQAFTWHVAGEMTSVWESAAGLETIFPWVGDAENLRREGDVAGFGPWSLAGDEGTSLVLAYRTGSAWREDNRWFSPAQGYIAWQPLWKNGGVPLRAGTYPGGLFRMAASARGSDRGFADRIAADLNGAVV